jgi:adenylate cyclase
LREAGFPIAPTFGIREATTVNLGTFFAELKRRNVYKVAIAYAAIGWFLIQAGWVFFTSVHAPDGVTTAVVTVIAAGFPIALVIAWAFEMTPQGMKRTQNISPNEFIPYWSRRKFATLIISACLAALALFIFQWMRLHHGG